MTHVGANARGLTPLDVLLFDESALQSLTHLEMEYDELENEAISLFASKLPRMKHLRSIRLPIEF